MRITLSKSHECILHKNLRFLTLVILIWLLAINQTFAAAKTTIKDHYARSITSYSRGMILLRKEVHFIQTCIVFRD